VSIVIGTPSVTIAFVAHDCVKILDAVFESA
jgi:hypothetical protein